MRYIICRTTALEGEPYSPCDGAYILETYVSSWYVAGNKFSKTYNTWVIDIDDLNSFVEKIQEKIVLYPKKDSSINLQIIEIYDGYREDQNN